jgi:ribose transport system ATP-binding protein
LENISGDGFTGVTLTAAAGEIVGVAGVVGNGQSQLLRRWPGSAASAAASPFGRGP